MNHRIVGAVLLGLSCSVGAAARNGPIEQPGLPRPNEIRIEGYVGEKPGGIVSEVDWVVSCRGKEYPFHVTKLRVLVGDIGYTDIIAAARQYRIAFKLLGDEPTLQRFVHAPNEQPIAVIAYQRTGGRDLLVAQVEYLGAPTPLR